VEDKPSLVTVRADSQSVALRGPAEPRGHQRIRIPLACVVCIAIEEGQTFSWERTFTRDDVEAFARLSGDRGTHHLRADEEGRIMVHGLLTATIPTKIGGDLDYIAREMTFEFLRPVFVGDTVRAEAVLTNVLREAGHLAVAVSFECLNQDGKKVLAGSTRGIIRSPS
jgi:3-hydroxybutyryl-CoA dehydratase